jgi:hypothetical protein
VLNVTFYGVRASARAAEDGPSRYGGHGRCVALEAPRGDAILLDLGTGVAAWAATAAEDGPRRTLALLTRADADHLAGLPLFEGEVLGPPHACGGDGTRWLVVEHDDLAVGDAQVTVRPLPHPDPVNGYRVRWRGVSMAYIGVHQAPPGLATTAPEVLELADGVDLLVHDGPGDAALLAAREAGARILALSGHRRDEGDETLDRVLLGIRRAAGRLGVDEVLVASEGTTVSFEGGGR